jgi:hypothetical protein
MDERGERRSSGSGSGGVAPPPPLPSLPSLPPLQQEQQPPAARPTTFDIEAPPMPAASSGAPRPCAARASEAWRDAGEALAFCTWAADTAAAAYVAVVLLSNGAGVG